MTLEEKIQCFSRELECINDKNLIDFLQICLETTGDWFYIDPASTSGKNHPKFALGEGGLIRHTKAVVHWVKELCATEMFNLNEREQKLICVAAILHDIRKHTNEGMYINNHARAAADLVIELQKQYPSLLSEQEAKFISDTISTHMGVWGVKTGERKPTTESERLLHLADYCASRKEIIF